MSYSTISLLWHLHDLISSIFEFLIFLVVFCVFRNSKCIVVETQDLGGQAREELWLCWSLVWLVTSPHGTSNKKDGREPVSIRMACNQVLWSSTKSIVNRIFSICYSEWCSVPLFSDPGQPDCMQATASGVASYQLTSKCTVFVGYFTWQDTDVRCQRDADPTIRSRRLCDAQLNL